MNSFIKYLVIVLSFFNASVGLAQNIFPTTGNVGIGTVNPTSPLEVAGPGNFKYNCSNEYWLKHTDLNDHVITGFKRFGNGLLIRSFESIGFSLGNSENLAVEIGSNGDLNAMGNLNVSVGNAQGGGIRLADDGDIVDLNDGWATHRFSYGLRLTNVNKGGNLVAQIANGASPNEYTYFNSGNVGVGTTTPQEKLSVNGNIRAKEIKVETANWPDYVFEKDYKITSLSDLEKYIEINKHLPDMPSAKEVENEGLELGEIVKKQQKIIEELTLFLINQNKVSMQQSNQLTNQQVQLQSQQQEINKLKKKTK